MPCCFLLTVAPMLTEEPVAVNVTRIEGTIVLTCGGFGFPIPTISWYQNGSLVEPEENDTATITTLSQSDLNTSSVLTIVRPVVNNSGDYHCILSSSVAAYQDLMSEEVLVLVQSKETVELVTLERPINDIPRRRRV